MAIGCYTARYLPASYKFVQFEAIEVESDHGRRGAEGEFPFGERTAYADLGRRIRVYHLRARFQENNHILQAAALIAVCEARGSGPLVHPTRGVILSAACRSLKVTDKVEEEQGVTYVDLELVEANNQPNGLSLISQFLGGIFSLFIGAIRTNFKANYTVSRARLFNKATIVHAAQNQVVGITNEYTAATAVELSNDVSRNRIIYDLQLISVDDTLASNADYMDKAISLGMSAISQYTIGLNKYKTFKRIANSAAKSSTFSGVSGTTENAVYTAVRLQAATYMVEGVLSSTGQTSSAVLQQLTSIDTILKQEQDIAYATCQNDLYLSIADFRRDAIEALYRFAYDAPTEISYNFGGSVHPLIAAYSIYGDAKRLRELEDLNLITGTGRFNGFDVRAVG